MNSEKKYLDIEKYSGFRRLQKKVQEKCARLPCNFNTLAEWESFREKMVQEMKRILPVWEIDTKGLHVETGQSCLGEGLVHETVDVHFEEGFYIPVHVYRSEKDDGKKPAVMVCHGFSSAKNSQDIIDVCIALSKTGFIALAMEYDGTGERATRPDIEIDVNNITALGHLLGINNVGLRVMNNLAALDYLKGRKDVDTSRIGITGLCQGAIITWFTAAICKEFSAVAPVCGVTTYEAIALEYCSRQGGWTGISPYVFGLLDVADVQHVVSAIAPRPLLVQNNLIDIHWPLSGFHKVKRLAENVYGLYGASDKCTFRLEDAPHSYAGPLLEKTVEWFGKTL